MREISTMIQIARVLNVACASNRRSMATKTADVRQSLKHMGSSCRECGLCTLLLSMYYVGHGTGATRFGRSTLVFVEFLPMNCPPWVDTFWDSEPAVNVVFASISNN